MKATLIGRKRLVKSIIARMVAVQGGTAGQHYLITLVCTDEEAKKKDDVLNMYYNITKDYEEVLTMPELKKLLLELEFKNMSDEALKGLINYCEACACEIIYSHFKYCPRKFAYAGKHTDYECVENYEKTAQPRMRQLIKDNEKNVCKLIGCTSFDGTYYVKDLDKRWG